MGSYAVFAFYILSGYLMAHVLTDVYGFSPVGTSRFLANRILRIYSPYLAVLLMSIAIFFSIKSIPAEFYFSQHPKTLSDWLKNIFIFGLKPMSVIPVPRLVGVAWTLYVELFYYLAMALFLARHRILIIAWFSFSLLLTFYLGNTGLQL